MATAVSGRELSLIMIMVKEKSNKWRENKCTVPGCILQGSNPELIKNLYFWRFRAYNLVIEHDRPKKGSASEYRQFGRV